MNGINEDDWHLVNAFHDGELSDREKAALQDRLTREPALKAALDQVATTSHSLKALKPHMLSAEQQTKSVDRRPLWSLGIAAAIALAAFGFWSFETRTPSLLEWHESFAERSFAVSQTDIRNVSLAATWGVHDLTAANLAPVASEVTPRGHVAHYAGLNGCRLSYFTVDQAFKLPPGPAAQAVAWTTADGRHHAIVATGMDLKKFDAIATYLQHATHDLARDQVYASLTQATETAVPCVG